MKPTQMFEKAQGLLLPEKQLKIYKNCTTRISYMYNDDFYFFKMYIIEIYLAKILH